MIKYSKFFTILWGIEMTTLNSNKTKLATHISRGGVLSSALNQFKQLSILALLSLSFNASALNAEQAGDQVTSKVINKVINTTEGFINDKANELANNFGKGRTSISIKGIDSKKPSYSIHTIQPLTEFNSSVKELTFIQGTLSSNENEGSRRNTINLGLGQRYLVEDEYAIAGVNIFTDYESGSKHKRASLGLEYQRSNFGITANKYYALSDNIEDVSPGHDINLSGQMPYAPWATIKGTHYYWDQTVGDNINGNVLGVEIQLSPSTSFEFGQQDSNTMERSSYAELSIKLPFGDNEKYTNFTLDDKPFRVEAMMDISALKSVKRSKTIKVEKSSDAVDLPSITIGTQIWSASNVSLVPTTNNVLGTDYWDAYVGTNGSGTAADEDGYYYTWDAAMNVCPSGWSLPSDSDWATLEEAAVAGASGVDWLNTTSWRGTTEGTSLKVGGTSGFNAKLAGRRNTNGSFYFRGDFSYLWSSTESGGNAYRRCLYTSEARVYRSTSNKAYGFSVRCLKD